MLQSLHMYPFNSIDEVVHDLLLQLIHPFPALLAPLCHLAVYQDFSSTSLFYTWLYTSVSFFIAILSWLNTRLEGGHPRTIEWIDEIILITGGVGGLGHALSEIYVIRGVSVAVVDVKPEDEVRERLENLGQGQVRYYRCDIGDRRAVEELKECVTADVSLCFV